ncbi:MAG: orotidine-5'-phosphate decarboxylase [Flavobacteriales bacterium]|nr:orotidine-5'-phosphate decarboxylase [Flavobacteriales bacterium]MCB9167695.1 orotidine-5'-phosphate decarboxylase [Flavobacteriales bacterium]
MTRSDLVRLIRERRSLLCVGLDTEEELLPGHFRSESHPVRAFNEAICYATRDKAVAYKLNLAFYEAMGDQGWLDLEATIACIRAQGEHFIIADAKRGDIGNTARKYADAFFDKLDVDAVTIAPYMGHDSVMPFLGRPGKWAIVLGVTSNEGAMDFQFLPVDGGRQRLFEKVMERSVEWGGPDELMFVVGATRSEVLAQARAAARSHFFLVPGVGAQGGDLQAVLDAGMTKDGGLLINSSRGILYAGEGTDAVPAARRAAIILQQEMERMLLARGVI